MNNKNFSKKFFLIALNFLLITSSQATYQELLEDAEGKYVWINRTQGQICSNYASSSSGTDYAWEVQKIAFTVAGTAAITFGVGPRAMQASNWALSQTCSAAAWAYERSEIAPLSKLTYKNTKALAHKVTKGLTDKLPEIPPLFARTSRLAMPISEVLPTSMNKIHGHILENLDHILSQGVLDSSQISNTGWSKKPIFGSFKNAQKSIVDSFNCCFQNYDYLLGYRYKNARYAVKIEKFFSKDSQDPTSVNFKNDFYKIHRSFKEEGKGQSIGKPRYYSLTGDKHEHVQAENLSTIEDIAPFIDTFIKSNSHSKKELLALFEEFLNVLSQSPSFPSAPDIQEIEGQMDLLLNTPEDSSSSSTSGSSQASSKDVVLDIRGSSSSAEKHKERSVEIYLATDEYTSRKHIYFLFPTKDTENHNILLHFKDKVKHPSSFLFEKRNGDSKGKEKED